jgi:Fe-S-cluster containining protein
VDRALPPFHACYEEYVRAVIATGEAPVTCSRGCGHCCSHYVSSVEPFELIRLHGRISGDPAYPSRLVAFHRRATLYRSLLEGRDDEAADDRALYRYYLRDQRCPFLSAAGECGVYSDRPMSCRMFFSQSHPSLCRGSLTVSPGNRNFIVELPEDIEAALARASALLGDLDLSENLFEGLLEANALFGRFDESAPAASED